MSGGGQTRNLRREILAFAALAVAVVGLVAGLRLWRNYLVARQDQFAYQAARKFLHSGNAAAALTIITQRIPHSPERPEATQKWLDLEVDSAASVRDAGRLLALYDRTPRSFTTNEDASLLAARAFLDTGKKDAAEILRKKWENRSAQPQTWFALEADSLVAERKPDQARALLQSRLFPGAADCGRLCRLALLCGKDDLTGAWNFLAQANALDSHNPDVRSFRAQILERIGKIPLARLEYAAAQMADPKNAALKDQLAEFYIRQHNYGEALDIWRDCLASPSPGFLWLKTRFWSEVARPVDIAWSGQLQLVGGELEPVLKLIAGLPQGSFWDAADFQRLPNAQRFAREHQEIFWLNLLELLRSKNESAVSDWLALQSFGEESWRPDLELALRRILSYRASGKLNPPGMAPRKVEGARHQFFQQLETLAAAEREQNPGFKMPPDLDALLRSDEVFSAAFLGAGWMEAALRFHHAAVENFPPWFAYGLAQALRFNRDAKTALAFAEKQTLTPELRLLAAELKLAGGETDAGCADLRPMAGLDSDIGFRAAWLLSLAAIDRGRNKEAADFVRSNRRLSESVTGQEILARIAAAESNLEEADRRYASIAETSVEAQAYLARQAYAQKDWTAARRYTAKLVAAYPDELQLRANMAAIQKQESGK